MKKDKKSLIASTRLKKITLFTRPVAFAAISFLAVALMYSSLSTFYTSPFYVFAAPPHYCFERDCPERICVNNPAEGTASCCWSEEGILAVFCQTCEVNTATGDFVNCSDVVAEGGEALPPPTPSPTGPEGALPQGEVQQLPPTGGKGLFGSEVLPTPPAGLAPPTEPPAPTSEPTVPPDTGQGEEDGTGGSGGIKPPVKDLLPETSIEEQPEVQQPEQEQPSGQGQGPAGPLT